MCFEEAEVMDRGSRKHIIDSYVIVGKPDGEQNRCVVILCA